MCFSISYGGVGWWRHQDLIAGKAGRERHRPGDQTKPLNLTLRFCFSSISMYLCVPYFITLTFTTAPGNALRKSFFWTSVGTIKPKYYKTVSNGLILADGLHLTTALGFFLLKVHDCWHRHVVQTHRHESELCLMQLNLVLDDFQSNYLQTKVNMWEVWRFERFNTSAR